MGQVALPSEGISLDTRPGDRLRGEYSKLPLNVISRACPISGRLALREGTAEA